MKKLFAAVALAIALPAAAFAQNAPAAGKMSCCDKKDMADCHKSMAGTMGDHMKGMDMSNMDHSTMGHDMSKPSPAQPSEQPQKHQQ